MCSLEDILFGGNVSEVCVSGTVKQLLSLITDWLYFGDGKSSRKQFCVFKKGLYKALSCV